MEWLLLYPLAGLSLATYYVPLYHKYDEYWNTLASVFLILAMPLLWPLGWSVCRDDIQAGRLGYTKHKEIEHEALLERVRREDRARTRREFAEFDKELGIEPEWMKAHPVAAKEYDRLMFSAGGLPNYSKGGRV